MRWVGGCGSGPCCTELTCWRNLCVIGATYPRSGGSQAIRSAGARTFSPFRSFNIFGKAAIPLGKRVRLTITPGYKHVDFNRRIEAAYNQTTRYAQRLSNTYTAELPFATVNYRPTEQIAAYVQYARGFLAPPLSVLYVANPTFSTVAPERSTNYQAGVVYHGRALSVDADVYKIDFTNKFATDPTAPAIEGTVYINQGAVTYKGVEGQATYALPQGFAVFANGSRNYAKTDNPGQPRTQVANAPEFTAAGGVLYKRGPIRFSLIDKYTGPQWFVNG